MKGEFAEGVNYYNQYLENIREAIREDFRLQNESERLLSWQEDAMAIENLKGLLVETLKEDTMMTSDVAALAYDGALLSKGILLNSSIEFEKVLREKGDQQMLEIYKQAKANAEQFGEPDNLVMGANIAAFVKVADAMMAQGLV